tara:strand:- start:6003 stop:6566 length:564 start_codon:yes stop_codon:yes gene_type:complete
MDIFSGRITSSGFSSGDRIVIGDWKYSPFGSFTNIMWAKSDGVRVLLSPNKNLAEYVSSLYSFEEVKITPIEVNRGVKEISVKAGSLEVKMVWSLSFPIPLWRPKWFISTFENTIAKKFFNTSTFGITRDGRKEWYSIRGISKVVHGECKIDGIDLGQSVNFEIDACFGFSEPPKWPSSVTLKSYIG